MDDTSDCSASSPYDYDGPPNPSSIKINKDSSHHQVAWSKEGGSSLGDETYVKKSYGTSKRVAKNSPHLEEPASKRRLVLDLPSSGNRFADDSEEEVSATMLMDSMLATIEAGSTLWVLPLSPEEVGAYIVTNRAAASPLSSLSDTTYPDSSEEEYDVPLAAVEHNDSQSDVSSIGNPLLSNHEMEGEVQKEALTPGEVYWWSRATDSLEGLYIMQEEVETGRQTNPTTDDDAFLRSLLLF
jgi:hypothetical protein